MKVNKIQFGKIKLQFDILKMKAAYIEAEHKLLNEADPHREERFEHFFASDTMQKEEYVYIPHNYKEIMALEELGRQALEREDYLEVAAIYKHWKKLKGLI